MNTSTRAAQPRGQTGFVCSNLGPGRTPLDRWKLLDLVMGLRRDLDLTDRDIMVLRAHLSVLPHGPLRPGRVNMSFMSIREILGRACAMEERRFRRGEKRLEECGLIRRRLSGNGRRFPERDREGQIVSAYGVDLTPLLDRHDELQALLRQREEEKLALRSRKNSVSARLSNALRSLAAAGLALPVWLDGLRDRLRRAVRRKHVTLEELDGIEAEIGHLESLDAAASAPAPAPPRQPNAEGSSHPRSTAVHADRSAVDDGQTVRRIESEPKEENSTTPREFDHRRISETWSRTGTIREFYPLPPKRERDAAEVLFKFSSFLGLGQTSIIHGLSVIGWEGMILALDYLAEKIAGISKPEGYLTTMIRSFEQGQPIAGGCVVPRRLSRNPRPI